MLPEILLDNENFEDILEEAKGKIASLYPEWTDYNYHDPGITLLELFAWLQESQHYYLDQIGRGQKEKFLKLMGESRRHKRAAAAMVNVDTKKNFVLPKGTKFYAADICFESTEKNFMVKDDIVKCFFVREQNIVEVMDKRQLGFGSKFKMKMFGKNPEAGDAFYIGMNSPLPDNMEISIYFDLAEDYKVRRNPIQGKIFCPFVTFEMEYFTQDGWRKVIRQKDSTNGFIARGQIAFWMDAPMERVRECGMNAYFIRIKLIDGVYDVPPVLQGFGINVFMVSQTDHLIEVEDIDSMRCQEKDNFVFQAENFLAQYGRNDLYLRRENIFYELPVFEKYMDAENGTSTFVVKLSQKEGKPDGFRVVSYFEDGARKKWIGEGNGFPEQQFPLYDLDLEYGSFEIMVHDIVSESGYVKWKKVSDFGNSKPEDKHFVLDTENGLLKFGDSIHGMAPEGFILAVCYVRTLGSRGNVKSNKINCFSQYITEAAEVTNQDNSYGGLGEETLEEAFLRVRESLNQSVTAVTYEDYERYVRMTPGLMIANCKVLPRESIRNIFPYLDEPAVSIAVKPYALKMRKQLAKIYQKNIFAYLDHFRLAGTSIQLLPPQYIRFSLYLEAAIKPQYIDGEERVKRVVQQYFEELENEFGATVFYSRLYGAIDLQDCVSAVIGLSMEVKGTSVSHLPDQSVVLPPNGVAVLEHVEYLFSIEK